MCRELGRLKAPIWGNLVLPSCVSLKAPCKWTSQLCYRQIIRTEQCTTFHCAHYPRSNLSNAALAFCGKLSFESQIFSLSVSSNNMVYNRNVHKLLFHWLLFPTDLHKTGCTMATGLIKTQVSHFVEVVCQKLNLKCHTIGISKIYLFYQQSWWECIEFIYSSF